MLPRYCIICLWYAVALSISAAITDRSFTDVMDEFGVRPLFVKLASPWENGYIEPLNTKMRDKLLDGEILLTLAETKYIVDR